MDREEILRQAELLLSDKNNICPQDFASGCDGCFIKHLGAKALVCFLNPQSLLKKHEFARQQLKICRLQDLLNEK